MFKKLKILTLLQLSDRVKVKKDLTFAKRLGQVGKTLLAMVVCFGIFALLFYVIFGLIGFKASENLLVLIIFITQALSIVSCTASLSDTLYISKDNQMLMTYPVKHIYVYISKLLVVYILELYKSLMFTFPLFMAYGLMAGGLLNVNYVVSLIFFSIFLPLVPVLVGAIISIPVVMISKLLKKVSWVKGILTVLIFVGLAILTGWIIKLLPDQIRLVALWNSFLKAFEGVVANVNKFSLYSMFVGRALYGNKPVLNNLYFYLTLLGVLVVGIALSLPLFFKLASSAAENSIDKKHSSKNVVHKSTFFTFMRKELLLSIRNMNDFSSNYLFLFVMPFVLVLMTSIFVRINRNPLGYSMTYAFCGLIALIMLSSSNTASATAISSEGAEFALLKTAPGKTSNIVWAKVLINGILSFVSLLISFILLSFFLGDKVVLAQLWLVFIFVVLIDIGLILWSIQLDILNPSMKEYATTQNRGDIKNFSTSIVIGIVASVIFSAVMIVLFWVSKSLLLNAAILVGLGLIFVGGRIYLLINYLNAYFHEIEL